MYTKLIVLFGLLLGANASGQLSILQVPSAIQFKGADTLKGSSYYDLIAASLGRHTEYDATWNGCYLKNPFEPATAVVSILVNGISELSTDAKHVYPLCGSPDPVDLDLLAIRIETSGSKAITLNLGDDLEQLQKEAKGFCPLTTPTLEKASASPLKPSTNSVHKAFLQQIEHIKAVTACVKEGKKLPEVLAVTLDLIPLAEKHDPNSAVLAEAAKLASLSINELANAIEANFPGQVLVMSAANKEAVVSRNKRQTKQQSDIDRLNLSPEYSPTYPVIFNIILWFGVAMFLSLIAICYVIGTMDPGRDSIIYRMTSTRMKKDN